MTITRGVAVISLAWTMLSIFGLPSVFAETTAGNTNLSVFEKNRQLWEEGDDVRQLQAFLNSVGYTVAMAGAGSLENETRLFGLLTYRALVRFQADNALPPTGFFGPLTRALLTQLVSTANTTTQIAAPISVAAQSNTSAPPPKQTRPPAESGNIQPLAPTNGYTPGFGGGGPIPPSVSVDTPGNNAVILGTSITIAATFAHAPGGVQFNVDGTNIGTRGNSTPYSVTWDSTTVPDGAHMLSAVAAGNAGSYSTSSITVTVDNDPPVISSVLPSNLSAGSATITWTTDEPSTSQVAYGATIAYGAQTDIDSTLTTNHSVTISGLSEGTTYHYQVLSTSAGGHSATSTDQVISTPLLSWSLPGATIDLDFANQQYLGGDPSTLLSVSRASPETCIWADGHVSYVGNNAPCITDLGLAVWKSSSNDLLWNRDLTNPVWVATGAAVVRDQIGVDAVAASASSVLATTTNATVLQSIALGSNARFQTAYVKRLAGSGRVDMTMDNGATWTAITSSVNSSTYTRISIATQTLANPVVGFRLVSAGDQIAIDMVQNEPGTIATAPILTTSATSSRAADVITPLGDLDSILASGAFSVYSAVSSVYAFPSDTSSPILGVSKPNGYSFLAYVRSWFGLTGGRASNGVTGLNALYNGNGSDGVLAASFSGGGRSLSWANGKVYSDSTNNDLYDHAGQIGGAGYGGYMNVPIKRLAFWNTRLSDAALQQLGIVGETNPNAAAGYTRLAFSDDFNSPNTVDLGLTGATGYKWYPQGIGYGWSSTTSPDRVNISNGIATLTGSIQTAFPYGSQSSQDYTGSVFSNGAYFEARLRFDPAKGTLASSWFPAFWTYPVEESTLNSHWPGQAAGYVHYAELDCMEAIHSANESYVGKTFYYTTLHDWSGLPTGSGYQYDVVNGASTHHYPPQSVDWNQFHTYGCLWVPQNGDTPGYVQWFFDGSPGTKTYYKGPAVSPPIPGQSGGSYNAPTADLATTTYSVLDQQHMLVTMGSDQNWPLEVDWVRVWQR